MDGGGVGIQTPKACTDFLALKFAGQIAYETACSATDIDDAYASLAFCNARTPRDERSPHYAVNTQPAIKAIQFVEQSAGLRSVFLASFLGPNDCSRRLGPDLFRTN